LFFFLTVLLAVLLVVLLVVEVVSVLLVAASSLLPHAVKPVAAKDSANTAAQIRVFFIVNPLRVMTDVM
jgi:hypothetical protein